MSGMIPMVVAAVGRASPSVIAAASSYVARVTGQAIAGAKGLVEWAKRSPAGAVLVATGLVTAGGTVSDLFADAGSTAEGRKLLSALEEVTAKVTVDLDSKADVKYGSSSSDANLQFLKELIQYYAKRYNLRGDALRREHLMSRAFIETSSADLERGILLFG